MIGLLEPLGIAALASLLLPLAIHFVRRAERRPLLFAALRFLNERRYPRREWQVQQWPLLICRLLLLAVVAVLLSAPIWRGTGHLAAATAVNSKTVDVATLAPTASRIRELDAQLPLDSGLTLVVPAELGGLDAERLQLRHAAHWQVVAGRSSAADSPSIERPVQSIAVRFDAAGKTELAVAKALSSAWNAAADPAISIDTAPQLEPLPAQTDWLLWLGGPLSAEARAWVSRGGRVLLTRDPSPLGVAVLVDAQGKFMFRERKVGRGRIVSSTAPLTVEAMPGLREASTAERLHTVLAAPLTAPDRARAADVAPRQIAVTDSAGGRSLAEYAALLSALLYLAERLWATRAV